MTFLELKEQLEQLSPEQLDQAVTVFVVRKGAQYASSCTLQFEEGDALMENGYPYLLV